MHYCFYLSASVFLAVCIRSDLYPSTNLGLPKSASCRSVRFLTQEGRDGKKPNLLHPFIFYQQNHRAHEISRAVWSSADCSKAAFTQACSLSSCLSAALFFHSFPTWAAIESRSSRSLGCNYIPVRKIRSFIGDTASTLPSLRGQTSIRHSSLEQKINALGIFCRPSLKTSG